MKSQLIAKVVMSGFTGGAFAAYDQRLNRHAVADSQIRHSLAYLRYLAGKLMPHYHRSDFLRYRMRIFHRYEYWTHSKLMQIAAANAAPLHLDFHISGAG